MIVDETNRGLRTDGTTIRTVHDDLLEVTAARVSPSYGVAVPSTRLLWRYSGELPVTLKITVAPHAVSAGRSVDADACVPVLAGKF